MENSLERNHNNIQSILLLLKHCFDTIINKKKPLNTTIYNSFIKHKDMYNI